MYFNTEPNHSSYIKLQSIFTPSTTIYPFSISNIHPFYYNIIPSPSAIFPPHRGQRKCRRCCLAHFTVSIGVHIRVRHNRTLTAKIGALSCIVMSQRSAKHFAHHSISACDFCKDLGKCRLFRDFWTEMSLPNYENFEK